MSYEYLLESVQITANSIRIIRRFSLLNLRVACKGFIGHPLIFHSCSSMFMVHGQLYLGLCPHLQVRPFFSQKVLIVFLFLYKNPCCMYSLEVPHRGTSNEYIQHMFSWINKKNIYSVTPPICKYACHCFK